MNGKGRYSSSLYHNTRTIKFIGPEKGKTIDNNYPPPWAYNLGTMFNKTGLQFTSKFNSAIAKTMSNRLFIYLIKKALFLGLVHMTLFQILLVILKFIGNVNAEDI